MDEKSTATNGRETTHASTIDTLAFHVALVGIVYLITYAELSWIEAHIKPFFDQYKWLKGFGATLSMPMFFIHGLIVAWLLRTLLLKLGAGRLMDPVVQTRITGASVDYLLTATLMSIHIVVLKQYVIPIFLVAFSVTLFALALNLWFGRRTNYGPERVLCQFGCCCGSTATGLLLLRIIDPDFSTPATLELAFFNVGILVTCAPILYFFAPAFYTFTGMEILMIYGAITVIGIAAMFALEAGRTKAVVTAAVPPHQSGGVVRSFSSTCGAAAPHRFKKEMVMLTNECTLISCPEILTMDEGKPTAEAVCISEGKILAVGTLEELRALAPGIGARKSIWRKACSSPAS